jgi:DNA-binding IclR family transcriptional regulator
MVFASATGTGQPLPSGLGTRVPIHVMAAGRAIALQLTTSQLDKVVPAEPYPGADSLLHLTESKSGLPEFMAEWHPPMAARPTNIPQNRAELTAAIARIRADGFARDHGELHPDVHCIAYPWAAYGAPSALSCVGTRDDIASRRRRIENCLRVAARPGAVAQDVIDAAATVFAAS